VNLAPVTVIRFFVSLSQSEVKRASDFVIKQDVAHRLQDARIKAERKFTELTSAENIQIRILIAVLDKLVFHTYVRVWKQSLN
jgi:hypothetical protein